MYIGDTHTLKFKIKNKDDYIDYNSYEDIEIQINQEKTTSSIKKMLSKNEIIVEDDGFSCELLQEDTFKLKAGNATVQVRLLLNNNVKATSYGTIEVKDSLSRKVLGVENE